MAANLVNGWNYTGRNPQLCALSRDEWRSLTLQILAAGGKRRVEDGETFLYARDGVMLYEAWANIPAPKINGGVELSTECEIG